jgi:hypothetical protein
MTVTRLKLLLDEHIWQVSKLLEAASAEELHNTCRWLHEFTSA